jgi:Zn-dependent protease with chaperone function
MTRTLLALGLFTVVLAFAAPADGAQPPKQQPPKNADPYSVQVTPEMQRHSHILDTLYFVGTAYSFLALGIVLVTGLSRRLRDAAQRVFKRPFLVTFVYFVLFSVVLTILSFPLDYYAGYVVPHQFDLTSQSFASWMGDLGKEFLVNVAIGGIIAALALFAIRKFARWWIPLWLGSIFFIILGIVIAPIFIDPIFNKFEPLHDAQLKQLLLDEASRAGIEGSRVYEVNKSKQTKTMNAYVTGLGPTNRIVLWDTLLQKMTHDEILAVMGHEMGHYVLRHIWQGVAWAIAISLVICWLAFQTFEKGLARWGRRWGVERKDDPAALPWLLIIVSAVSFLLSPALNGISRHMEHQADVFGLELTHLNDAMARSFVKFATDSKVDPTPNRFIEFWRYSHPSLTRRIDFVRNYKPWEHGQPNALYKR